MMANSVNVKVTKTFHASPDNVFDAWLDPEIIARWMFGPNLREEKIVNLQTTPKKGGTFSFVVIRDGEKLDHKGTYRTVDRPHTLVFTWGVNEEAGDESVVTVTIKATKSGCQLTLAHKLAPKWETYTERTKEGWNLMLQQLKTELE